MAVPGDPPAPLIWLPAGAGHAVWWLFAPDGAFTGWYVNLERRVHGADVVDVDDQELDIVVAPDRTWAWKEEKSFAEKTGRTRFWTAAEATAIRPLGSSRHGPDHDPPWHVGVRLSTVPP